MNRWIMTGGLIAILLGTAGCGPRAETRVTREAERYFELLREGQTAEAYALLSADRRREMAWEDFRWVAEALGLTGHRGVAWEVPRIEGNQARITGVVTTRNGSPLRQEVVCVREGRNWILQGVGEPADQDAGGALAEARARQPSPEEMQDLARTSLRRLADALAGGDFTAFHRELAPVMRDALGPERLQESFGWLAGPEAGIDWTSLEALPLEFSHPPALDAEGNLTLTGRIPLGEKDLGFELRYVYEPPEWMLASILVRPPR